LQIFFVLSALTIPEHAANANAFKLAAKQRRSLPLKKGDAFLLLLRDGLLQRRN
jgi:hypothetical protein